MSSTRTSLMSLLAAIAGACQPQFDEMASGFDIDPDVRPALSEDGTVVAAEATRLLVGNGSAAPSALDLAPLGLEMLAATRTRQVQIRAAGDIAFLAQTPVAGCMATGRGAFRIATAGGPVTTLHTTCPTADPFVGGVGREISLSPNGTVAFSSIVNGQGALLRGPVAGPVAVLRSGTGTFYNTQALDSNDAGRVVVQMEYFDGFAGGLMRGVLAFDTPEQDKLTLDTAVEKLGIGQQPQIAINAGGTVVFSLGSDFTMNFGGTMQSFVAGVYRATPTLFNSAKSLTLVADLSGPYCAFGNVDINAAGEVVFEARLDGNPACSGGGGTPSWNGIYRGADPAATAVVERGEAGLDAHQFFDDVVLGHINDANQVSFTTTYSEPLVEPVKVWRRQL